MGNSKDFIVKNGLQTGEGVKTAAGTVSNPAFSFSDKPDTGTYLSDGDNYAISVDGQKAVELEPDPADGKFFEIFNQSDDVIFSIGNYDFSEPIFEVFSTTEVPLIRINDDSITMGVSVDIDSTLTFANGSIENVVSDVSVGEGSASSSAIKNIIKISFSDYEGLASPDPDTLYVVID